MQRTQISLTSEERQALDAVALRTGRSVSSLIRQAVDVMYGVSRTADEDLEIMRQAFGAWRDRDATGEEFVEKIRGASRLRGSIS